MDIQVKGRAYIVTGASSGLGFASAAELVKNGAKVVVASRSAEHVEDAGRRLRELAASAEDVVTVAADLGDDSTATTLVSTATKSFGRLDGAMISVGGPSAGPMSKTTDDEWRHAFNTVFLGALRLARAALDDKPYQDAGMAVTMVLSTSVKSPIPNLAISNGLRPGLAMAAKTLADEYGPEGGRVNVLMPGRIDTDRVKHLDELSGDAAASKAKFESTIPLRRYGTPQEFGRVATFVTSPAASYISGAAIPVDGGALQAL